MDTPFDVASLIPLEPASAVAALADSEQVAGRFDTAVALYRLARSLAPHDIGIGARFARALFCREDWDEAWRAYRIRFQLAGQPPRVARRRPDGTVVEYPRWSEGPPPRRILVLHEQGLGDSLHFCRFLPDLLATGTALTLVVPAELTGLMKRLDLPMDVRALGETEVTTGIEAWIPMLDLPLALRIGRDGLGRAQPYLPHDEERRAHWRQRIGEGGLKVGIAWAGNPDSPGEPGRSASPAVFAPLAAIPGIRLFCLQKGGEAAARASALGDAVEELGPDFDSGPEAFRDSAALIGLLDAVVTVDTAIAHLAGGLGAQVHVMLKSPWADWRWLGRESDTVWYPGMTLYRQARPGDWSLPVARIAAALAARQPAARGAADRGNGSGKPRPQGASPQVPVSVGDLVDRIAILEIKAVKLTSRTALAHVMAELGALRAARKTAGLDTGPWRKKADELRQSNERLWALEEEIRAKARAGEFDAGYVALARAVHEENDRRSALKRAINELSGSALVEEKSYASG